MPSKKVVGFTLIELMIVIAIVGIMAMLAGFAMERSRKNGRVAAEVRRTVSRLQQARTMAVTTGVCHGVLISGPQSALTYTADGPPIRLAGRTAIFKKPPGTAGCLPFDPNADKLRELGFWSEGGFDNEAAVSNAGRLRQVNGRIYGMQWDMFDGQETTDIFVYFEPTEGRPTVFRDFTQIGPNFPAGAPLRWVMRMRDTSEDRGAGDPTNNRTVRCFEMGPAGSVLATAISTPLAPTSCP